MTITTVRFHGTPRNEFVSYVAVVFDDVFVINNMKLVKSKRNPNELMLCMPSRQKDNGDYADIAHPITQPFREYLQGHVINAWNQRDRSGEPARQP